MTTAREAAIHADVVALGTTKARESAVYVEVVVTNVLAPINGWAVGVVRFG